MKLRLSLSPYAALHARIASRLAVLVSGASVGSIGTASLVGYYVTGIVRLYQWDPNAIAMAPNTALGFVLTGFGMTVIAASNRVWRCS